ncbi:TPA: hypothetical protein ACGD7V_000861 [Serratia marcescens]|nr:phage-like protein [Serratia marcescens]BEN81769.1 phage-like protein [Serratia marcescens]
MKEHPVIFNGEMVRAILDGRKTQTRRVMKVQPSEHFHPMNMALELDYSARWYTPGVVDKDGYLQPAKNQIFGVAGEDEGYACPFGAVGERLWVRETFADVNTDGGPAFTYRADHGLKFCLDDESPVEYDRYPGKNFAMWCSDLWNGEDGHSWSPSIHMPRWASRILLEITAVRVERLNDISESDAKDEGVRAIENNFGNGPAYCDYLLPNLDDAAEWYNRASDSFKSLWKSIYGEESWRANPWVWVIEFRRVGGSDASK